MSHFFYEAITSEGKVIKGNREGASVADVEQWLKGQQVHPVVIRMVEGSQEASGKSSVSFLQRLQGISLDDRILFCSQMATMLDAGVPILQALNIMARQASNPLLSTILLQVADSVEEGARLSDAFLEFPKFAEPLYFNVIRVGEETGTLDTSFLYLSQLYENEKEISERIKAATRYPKIVIAAMFGAVFFLMSFVVPKFIDLFRNARVELPLPTRILINISDFTVNYFWLILLGLVVGVVGYSFAMRYDQYRMIRDKIWLKVPIFGVLSVKIYMARFCKVFSVLLKSGVDVVQTLKLSSTALENLVLYKCIEQVTDDVRDGNEIHIAMERHDIFPDMVVQMTGIGEQAGQVDEMMEKVAKYYDRESNYLIKNLSTMLEPILLLFMGVMVGFLALAIYMPMWEMMNVMKGG